jgi:Methane/Phenol/Toluene Hydroxylase/YHS domain
MKLLSRDDWYDIAHELDWTLSYVEEKDAFPAEWTGSGIVPKQSWQSWEEPFRVSYRDYVAVQREKEAAVSGVRETLKRSRIGENLDPAVTAISHFHMGALCMVEQLAVSMLARFARFAPSPRWRNISVFGMLDEIRHAQLHLLFSHDRIRQDPRFDWCQKAFHTNQWAILAIRSFCDDWIMNANCVDATIATNLTLEHGFTNLQFIALAGNAMDSGNIDFSNLLSSIQTDEARHAQQGFPTLEILMRHDPTRAQRIIDVSFWRAFRLFQALTGPPMDYYTPLKKRKMSFKEFMLEWVVEQHERVLRDYGLQRPWYFDTFLRCLDHGHHSLHLGMWFWRPTLFWKPNAGVSRAERRWLNSKYPDWESSWGVLWDEIIHNIRNGELAKTLPETLPALCSVTQLPVGTHWDRHHLECFQSRYEGRTYYFDSDVSKWCFDLEPERYAGHLNVVERFVAGLIQPPDLPGLLGWMGVTPEVMGDDVYDYHWVEEYAEPLERRQTG